MAKGGKVFQRKELVIGRCVVSSGMLKSATFPDEVFIDMRVNVRKPYSEKSGVIDLGWEQEAKVSVVLPPESISYAMRGRLTGEVAGHQVSVSHDGYRHFQAVIDGQRHDRLSLEFVEMTLVIPVQKKRAGGNSEPVPRAIWRHLADRYNAGDLTVDYEWRQKGES